MKLYAVALVVRDPASTGLAETVLGSVRAPGVDLAKLAARRRWSSVLRPGRAWLRIEGVRERETVPGRR